MTMGVKHCMNWPFKSVHGNMAGSRVKYGSSKCAQCRSTCLADDAYDNSSSRGAHMNSGWVL